MASSAIRQAGIGTSLPAVAGRRRRAALVLLYLSVAGLALSPLAWVQLPALVDYPNHLARMWILLHDRDIAALAHNYVVDWRVLPDLAMDAVVPPLAQIVSIELAGRLFIALTLVLLLGGTVLLHRALHGEIGAWPLGAALFLYNAVLFWGFVSCLFGIGAVLIVFSAWVATRSWRIVPRLLLFAVSASLLFLAHLFAFGLYGLLVAAYELGLPRAWRRQPWRSLARLALPGLQFLPGMLLWRASLAHSGATLFSYGNVGAKLYALLAPFTFGFVPVPFDALFAAAACTALAIAAWRGALTVAPAMRAPLAALAVAALAMPNVTSGSWLSDIRVPVALPFVIIAATRLSLPRRETAALLGAVALGVLGVRVWTVTAAWRAYDHDVARYRAAATALTPGARLLVVSAPIWREGLPLPGVPRFFAVRQPVAYVHMAAYSVIDRGAFLPYLFTGWTTVDVTPRNRPVAQRVAAPATPLQIAEVAAGHLEPRFARRSPYGELPYWRDWPQQFDFALWLDLDGQPVAAPAQLQPIAEGGFFRLYRIKRPAAGSEPALRPQAAPR